MRFKPIFEAAARGNTNEEIVFCTVQTNENREAAMAFQVQAIPQFNFILNQQPLEVFKGADEAKFRAALAKLQEALSGSSQGHGSLKYLQFKPMNKLPTTFAAKG